MGKYNFSNKRLEKMRTAAFKATGPRDKVHVEDKNELSIFGRYLLMVRDPMTLVLLIDELTKARRKIKELKYEVDVQAMDIKAITDFTEAKE
jgi:hypothetical protein